MQQASHYTQEREMEDADEFLISFTQSVTKYTVHESVTEEGKRKISLNKLKQGVPCYV